MKLFQQTIKLFAYLLFAFIFIFILFLFIRKTSCGKEGEVATVAFPIAQAVVKHVEAIEIPNKFINVKSIPYEFDRCLKRTKEYQINNTKISKTSEECYFNKGSYQYQAKLIITTERNKHQTRGIDIIVTRLSGKFTKVRYEIIYSNNRWRYTHYPKPIIKNKNVSWFCNPKLFRLTD